MGSSAKESSLDAIEHLLARYLEMRPLFLAPARPMKLLWKMIPYLGVLLRFFSARNSAFSAPRIWMVEAGHLARLTSDPECEMSLAPTTSPISAERLGATECMRSWRYWKRSSRYSESSMTLRVTTTTDAHLSAKRFTLTRSISFSS